MSPVPVQDVLDLIEAAVVLVGIVTVGFSTVGAIAVWREGRQGAGSFFHMFERLQVLQLLTVMLVIAAATLLGLFGILDSNGITGILSGVAGYVLGGLNRQASAVLPASKPVAADGSKVVIIGKDVGDNS
jgi:hypothetical protein